MKKHSLAQIVIAEYEEDYKLYRKTLATFRYKLTISPASIQRTMKVSYSRASKVLDRFIESGFASPRIGSYPCIVNRKKIQQTISN